ncbi:hypothetical protein AJ87_05480 [Rhizobium yanglingense]|nr:hypothetical protein AJ87_05480 [Rhizobium yanglingense]
MVPADEVDRVGKIGAPRSPIAGRRLIVVPGAVERLRIAVGGRRTRPGNEAKKFVRGGRAFGWKPDSTYIVAIRIGTGTAYFFSARSAACCQLLKKKPLRCSKTAQMFLV